MDIKDNVELFLEAPLLIISFLLAITGVTMIPESLIPGVALVLLSSLIVVAEKLIERWDSIK